jgi:hypothetical protein
MPDLIQSLQGQDLGHLQIVAGLWGVELHSTDTEEALRELAGAILNQALSSELIASLGPDASAALLQLAAAGGRIPWASFARKFGDVREMGAGKRDREKPYLKPVSAAEGLFYRGLLARAFFDTTKGPQEFAYIPDDWLPLIRRSAPAPTPRREQALGRAATPAERADARFASDRILDDATTLLAAVRSGRSSRSDPFLRSLLTEARILRKNVIQAGEAKAFLESSRPDALQALLAAWRASEKLDELRLMPELICEGQWSNGPLATRRYLLGLLDAMAPGTWWSLAAFINQIKDYQPDFQRPSGDYDSWFIKSALDGRYLRGFADWDNVDGALIRFFVAHVCYRLGMVDLAGPDAGRPATAFRIIESRSHPSRFPSEETGRVHVSSQGVITVPRLAPRAARYQLARFCEWDDEKPDEYRYHVTPHSLDQAKQQGLKVEHLLAVLGKHADAPLPAPWVKALKRLEKNGIEARAESQIVLRVSSPEILEELRKSRATRFLGERLGPTTIVIKRGAQSKVMAALAELGILGADESVDQPTA